MERENLISGIPIIIGGCILILVGIITLVLVFSNLILLKFIFFKVGAGFLGISGGLFILLNRRHGSILALGSMILGLFNLFSPAEIETFVWLGIVLLTVGLLLDFLMSDFFTFVWSFDKIREEKSKHAIEYTKIITLIFPVLGLVLRYLISISEITQSDFLIWWYLLILVICALTIYLYDNAETSLKHHFFGDIGHFFCAYASWVAIIVYMVLAIPFSPHIAIPIVIILVMVVFIVLESREHLRSTVLIFKDEYKKWKVKNQPTKN